ncbi:hypothetical protein OAC40_00475 [bacterium]|nr:hypothetical protein [bacterium]
MQVLSLKNTKKTVSALWNTVIGAKEVDRGYDPYERAPVRQSEISAMLALHYRKDDPQGFSKVERRDHDNLAALRDILYPSGAN